MINTDYQMIALRPEEEFGPFEGSMYIGGATAWVLETYKNPSIYSLSIDTQWQFIAQWFIQEIIGETRFDRMLSRSGGERRNSRHL